MKADKASGSRTVVIGAAAFVPDSNSPTNEYYINTATGLISVQNGAPCFAAKVEIPTGATVTALRLDASDSVALDESLTMLFDPYGPAVPNTMAGASTSGSPGGVTVSDLSIGSPVIDNATRSYALRLCMSTGLFFYDARIDYTLP